MDELLEEVLVPMEDQPYKIPKNWIWTNLGSVLKLSYGKSLPKKNRSGNGFPVFGSNGIVGYHSEPLVEGPIVIVGRKGSHGVVNWFDKSGWPIDTTYYLEINKGLELRYYYYLLKNLNLQRLNRSTAIPGLNREDAYNLTIAFPPKAEQKRIANKVEHLLNKIDKAKQLIEEAKETFELRRAAILDKAFRGKLTAKWREETKSSLTADQFLDNMGGQKEIKSDPVNNKVLDNLYSLPKGWKWVRLNDLIESSTYGTSAKTNDDASGVPVIRMGNIFDGKLRLDRLKYLPTDHADVKKLVLEEDDLLFNRTNSYELVGKTALVTSVQAEKMTFASYLIRVRLFYKEKIARYVCRYINSYFGRSILMTMVTQQVGQANINSKKLAALPIPLPPEDEVDIISKLLNDFFSKEEKTKDLLLIEENIEHLKQSILSKAFRGELGTNDPREESAIELLKEVLQEQLT